MSFPLGGVYMPFSFTSDFLSTKLPVEVDKSVIMKNDVHNSIVIHYTENSVKKTMTIYFTSISIRPDVIQESQIDIVSPPLHIDVVQQESQTDIVPPDMIQESQTDIVQPRSKLKRFFRLGGSQPPHFARSAM